MMGLLPAGSNMTDSRLVLAFKSPSAWHTACLIYSDWTTAGSSSGWLASDHLDCSWTLSNLMEIQ